MFLGHIGMGIAAKKFSPSIPLGVLIPLGLLPDIFAIPGFIFPGQTPDFVPWTHGLFMSIVIALGALAIAYMATRRLFDAVVIGSVVFSHWILDFISWPIWGRKLPLFVNGSPEVGLGLYSTTAGSIFGEVSGLIFIIVAIILLKKKKKIKKIQDQADIIT